MIFPESVPNGKIGFGMDLLQDTNPITIPPYWMGLTKLKESRAQLKDLLDKGFIRPSFSRWGCSGFVCEEEGWVAQNMY